MPLSQSTQAELDAALAALTEPGRLRAAEQRVASMAPQLQQILMSALEQGGWFADAERSQVKAALDLPVEEDRVLAVRTLLAEETRMGMLVGVAVGWELARELEQQQQEAPDPATGSSAPGDTPPETKE